MKVWVGQEEWYPVYELYENHDDYRKVYSESPGIELSDEFVERFNRARNELRECLQVVGKALGHGHQDYC